MAMVHVVEGSASLRVIATRGASDRPKQPFAPDRLEAGLSGPGG